MSIEGVAGDGSIGLRAFAAADAPALASLVSDPETVRWNPMSPDDPAAWIDSVVAEDERSVTFAVADGVDDRLLGTVAIFSVDREQGCAELGYRVLPAERGRGVATAAVTAMAEHGFGQLGLRRIQLFHAVDNSASCRVATRAGFGLEGTLRQSYVYGDGVVHDEHLHARLATDLL